LLKFLPYAYLALLFVEFLFFLMSVTSVSQPPGTSYENPQDRAYQIRSMQQAWAASYASCFLYQQLVTLVLLTPAVTAGALGLEKERNTLAALFETELTALEIVTGKLLGRLTILAVTALVAMPFLLLLAPLADLTLGQLLLACGQLAVVTFALAAGCMLISVWTKRTADAIIGCYAVLICTFLIGQLLLADRALPAWLDPIPMLGDLATAGAPPKLLLLLAQLAVWGGAGVLCLAVAARRLRPAHVSQEEKRPHRWLWAFRPPVNDTPIRWRERHVIGLAPLPWLRGVPGWMGRLGVFGFSAILAGQAIDYNLGPLFRAALTEGRFGQAYRLLQQINPQRVGEDVLVMWLVLVVMGVIVVGVRCGDSIASEKRRKTWEDLVLTSLSLPEIACEKRWGVLQATIPYLILYGLPFFGLAALGGWSQVWTAAAYFLATAVCLFGAAWLGSEFSASADSANDGGASFPGEDRGLTRVLGNALDRLTVAQRITLVQQLGDRLIADLAFSDMTDAQRLQLDRRLADLVEQLAGEHSRQNPRSRFG
jgi:ABC-type Na+ efflux pump permease subunit